MGAFFYGNTYHPELLTRTKTVIDTQDNVVAANWNGVNCIKVPASKLAYVDFTNDGLSECYISLEVMPLPRNSSWLTKTDFNVPDGGYEKCQYGMVSDLYQYLDTISYVGLSATKGSLNDLTVWQRSDIFSVNHYHTSDWDFNRNYDEIMSGNIRKWIKRTNTCFGSETLFGEGIDYCKMFLHIYPRSDVLQNVEVTCTYGHGTKVEKISSNVCMLWFRGVLIRNIIVSDTPISFSDTIMEVPVDSIMGRDWYTSDGKHYTDSANTTATIKLNDAALNSVLSKIEPRKVAIAGISNRQGNRITAIELNAGGITHQQKLDTGDHVFGTAWDVTSSDIRNTMTVTSRRVV